MTKKVWFITGASKGFGLILVNQLLKKGYKVAASSRDINQLVEISKNNTDFLPVEIKKLSDFNEVHNAVQSVISKFWENS